MGAKLVSACLSILLCDRRVLDDGLVMSLLIFVDDRRFIGVDMIGCIWHWVLYMGWAGLFRRL